MKIAISRQLSAKEKSTGLTEIIPVRVRTAHHSRAKTAEGGCSLFIAFAINSFRLEVLKSP